MPTHQPPPEPPTVDLAAILDRAEQAYADARSLIDVSARAGLTLPASIREHFNYDVPALIGALRHRGAQLNLVGIAVNLPSDQATTDTAPYVLDSNWLSGSSFTTQPKSENKGEKINGTHREGSATGRADCTAPEAGKDGLGVDREGDRRNAPRGEGEEVALGRPDEAPGGAS